MAQKMPPISFYWSSLVQENWLLRPRWTFTSPPVTTAQATVPVPPTSQPRFSNLSMLVLQWASLAVLTLLLLLVMADCAFRRNLSTSHTYTTPPYDDAETYV